MRLTFASLCLAVLATPLPAADCPPGTDHSDRIAALLSEVRAAETEAEARRLTNAMWAIWAEAPDEAAQAVLDRGMEKRAAFDLLGAIAEFDILVDYCPDYAEGYNQRAFAHFIRGDYPAALTDLDRALARDPNHVAAMAGRALTLMGLGRTEEGQAALRAALALHPWLPERRMLTEAGTDL
ncbi:tetratricopeptide repeat protein [Pseudooceanicola sp. LIPI14-2-Ac024]|uniref:tetratricopeptide repeat protein n=1 Tax=Pseudooceanicola sp. LIPI14-2-Ac024 TaxID=3344875 RepID=UPI0035CEEFA8